VRLGPATNAGAASSSRRARADYGKRAERRRNVAEGPASDNRHVKTPRGGDEWRARENRGQLCGANRSTPAGRPPNTPLHG
jgi:hypothetical protein